MISVISAVSAAALAASAATSPSVEVRAAAARVVVIPEARSDIALSVAPGDARLPRLEVRRDGERTVVDGGLDRRITRCWQSGPGGRGAESRAVDVRGLGRVAYRDLPVVTVHVPLAAAVAASGAVWGEVGPTRALQLAYTGCGDWAVAPVREGLRVSAAGSGDTHATSAGRLDYTIAGSGDFDIGAVDGPADLEVDGSGDVRIARVSGPVASRTAGSGDVQIEGGRTPRLSVDVAGSGNFTFGGEAGALSATVAGSGDVHVAHVSGPIARRVQGSGEVTVGR